MAQSAIKQVKKSILFSSQLTIKEVGNNYGIYKDEFFDSISLILYMFKKRKEKTTNCPYKAKLLTKETKVHLQICTASALVNMKHLP